MKQQKRHKLQIFYDILSAIEQDMYQNEGTSLTKPTHVQQYSRLSYDKMTDIFGDLKNKHMILRYESNSLSGTDFMKKRLLVTDSSSILQSSGKDQGTLIVTVKIVNKLAKLAPSDIRVTIHGNDPVPSLFRGNISGTPVRLHMGMYSATATGPSGYAPAYSGDIFR